MDPEHDNHADPEEIVRLLEASRPVPRPAFRGALRRTLLAQAPDLPRALPRPVLMRQILAFAGSGAALLVIAAAGLVGLGPFAT